VVVENLEFHIKRTGNAAAGGINNTAKSMRNLSKASGTATKHTNQLLSSLKRIAMYRLLRTIIKDIGKAFSEGLKNAYTFSKTINGQLSQALDSIASHGMQMKNQLGSALGELLMSLRPIIEGLANLITRIADALSQLFAVLGGRSTYNKATKSTENWAKAAGGAAKAAKEWKNQLLGFDEINKLEAPSDSSGGGSSTDSIGSWEEANASFKWAEELKKITMDWWKGLNLDPIINTWEILKNTVGIFIGLVDNGLRWAYENVLLPLASWTIETAAPALVLLLANAFDFLNTVIEKLTPSFKKLWENHLKPFAQWCGNKFIKIVTELSDAFLNLAKKVEDANSLKEFLDSLDGKEIIVLAVAVAVGVLALNLTPMKLLILGIVAAGTLLVENWDKIKEGAANFRDAMQPVIDAFTWVRDRIVEAIEAIKTFFAWLNSLNIVKSANSRAAAAQANGSIYLQGFASGGYPDEGELFWARERGPELVGSIGGRTAVANNDDIVASVSTGVYEAVSSALGGSFGNQVVDVRVFLDSKEIKAGQQRLARATGSA